MRIFRAAAATLPLAACGPAADPAPAVPRPPPLVIERRACLAEPPPEPAPGVVWEACADPAWAACLSRESAVLVLTYLRDLTRYARDAYDLCGPEPEKETP